MNLIHLFLVYLVLSDFPGVGGQIRIDDPSGEVRFFISDRKLRNCSDDLTYYWYSGKSIHSLRGAYSGYLLNGLYELREFVYGRMIERGTFRYGLKHGTWYSWYHDGQLKEVCEWKNGIRNGKMKMYDHGGKLLYRLSVKRGVLHGKCEWFNNDQADQCVYSEGIEQTEKRILLPWE